MNYPTLTTLARSMYLAENPEGRFDAEDEAVRLYWLRRAVDRERTMCDIGTTAMEPTNARENAMTEDHSPLPWTYDGHHHYNDNGGQFREILDARGEPVVGEVGSISHEDAELVVAATCAYALLAAGWSVSKVSLYDEEGVEGWQWNGPHYAEHTVIGSWDALPPVPDELMTRK